MRALFPQRISGRYRHTLHLRKREGCRVCSSSRLLLGLTGRVAVLPEAHDLPVAPGGFHDVGVGFVDGTRAVPCGLQAGARRGRGRVGRLLRRAAHRVVLGARGRLLARPRAAGLPRALRDTRGRARMTADHVRERLARRPRRARLVPHVPRQVPRARTLRL